jgi:predicted ATPase
MISEIEVGNVRLFAGEGWKFPLSPLTVFCGTNNVGKTTLLKTLLLLRQSLSIREKNGQSSGGRLQFSGSDVNLGSYASFIAHNERERDMLLALTIEDRMPLSLFERLCRLHNNGKKETSTFIDENASNNKENWLPYTLKVSFRFRGINVEQTQTDGNEQSQSSEYGEDPVSPDVQGMLIHAQYEVLVNNEKLLFWEVFKSSSPTAPQAKDPEYTLRIPMPYVDWFRDVIAYTEADRSYSEECVDLNIPLQGLLPEKMDLRWLSDEDSKKFEALEIYQRASGSFSSDIEETQGDFRRQLANIHYLAPLRSPARRYYLVQDDNPAMDPFGEFLPYTLKERGQTIVSALSPGQSEVQERTLLTFLSEWLYYLRTGQVPEQDFSAADITVEVDSTRGVLLEIKVKTIGGGEAHALADSGFGYSQVLPILVRGLLARPGSTLIIEQPELHLNPALHVRLAEFFVALVRSGRQVLIETHSEHIVDGIRVLAAEDETEQLADMCRVFFLDIEAGRPVVHDLSIKPDGSTAPNWPGNFFGEARSLTGRLLRAQKRFRQKAQKNGKNPASNLQESQKTVVNDR